MLIPESAAPGFEGPLSDLTVFDLSDEVTAQGARMLAELGADVVRVEDAAGDDVRTRPPYLHEEEDVERSLAHLLFTAGKRSLALDLSRSSAWGVVGISRQMALAESQRRCKWSSRRNTLPP